MSTSDGNSTTRPLRRRQSKRFDRSGAPPATGSTIIETDDDDDVEVDLPEPDHDEPVADAVAVAAATDIDPAQESDPDTADGPSDAVTTPEPITVPTPAPTDEIHDQPTDAPARSRPLDEMTPCGRCGHDVSTVHIEVDGHVLMMESCDNCDTRRWQLAGEPIELQQALDHVGEHTGRRR